MLSLLLLLWTPTETQQEAAAIALRYSCGPEGVVTWEGSTDPRNAFLKPICANGTKVWISWGPNRSTLRFAS